MCGLAVFVLATTSSRKALAAGWFLGAPLFVVLGDGYFEFERHMTPYRTLVPVLALIALQPRRAGASDRAETVPALRG